MLPDFRVRQRDYMLEISRAITEELDLEKVLKRIVRVSSELLAGRAGLIALREEGKGWRIAVTHGITQGFLSHLQRLVSDIPDHSDPARFELPEVNRRLQRITEAASMGLLTGIGLPLISRNEVVGVIFVFRSYRGRFSTQDTALLQGFASQAATAVHNARLFSQVASQKKHLDAVLESSADGIFILNPSARFLRFNRACSRMTGYSSQEVINRKHSDVIRWKRIEQGPSLEQAEAGGWPLSLQSTLYVEGDLLNRDGETVSVGITYAPTLSRENTLLSIVANMRDISRFREAEELKSTFISVVSHELRTPVALIKGYVGTLRREDARWDPDVVKDSLAVIEDEADRLSQLIDDLLDASRLQAGALELSFSELRLDVLSRRVSERFATQSPDHNFSADFPPDFPLVIGDEDRLTQVLSNLLSNAVKFSPAGGDVTIHGQVHPNEVAVCVQDQGPGIASHDVAHIFDRFYRASETAPTTQGTGLGLFLAKAVVEAHDGKIWVDERVRNGARICFSLPRIQPE